MKLADLSNSIATFSNARIGMRNADGTVLDKTYAEFRADVARVQDYLRRLGLNKDCRVGLYAENCYEWMVLDLACIELGIFLIAFSNDTFHVAETAAIFRRYGLAVLFTDKTFSSDAANPVIGLAEILREKPPERIVSASTSSVSIPDDHFSLSFSSGSTGAPKGMVVSRAGAEFLLTAFIHSFGISSSDTIFIFLPLSNFQQRLLVYAALYTGANIALTTCDDIFHDLKLFTPSFFVAPPVLFKNILKLFDLQRDEGESLLDWLGGNIRFALVGMAPIEARVIQEFHDNGVLLLESYGLSESGIITWNTPGRCKIGTVGMPLDAREVSFSDEQELLVNRKAPLCLGYFDGEESNAGNNSQTFRSDGVIATGDLACMDDDGFMTLTGRKKNVVVTASGHKYQPEPIEKRINLISRVNSAIVYHSLAQQCNVVLINMDEHADAAMLATLHNSIESLNQTLPDHQRIAKILVNADPYTTENKLLTPNLKLNRQNIIRKYGIY